MHRLLRWLAESPVYSSDSFRSLHDIDIHVLPKRQPVQRPPISFDPRPHEVGEYPMHVLTIGRIRCQHTFAFEKQMLPLGAIRYDSYALVDAIEFLVAEA